MLLELHAGIVTCTPTMGYCGPDSFKYTAADFNCTSNVGTVSITVCNQDSDGDGVPDAQDDCPGPDLRSTVHVGDCDTGVPNLIGGSAVDSHGCSLADLIHQDLVNAANGATNHGQFVHAMARALNSLVQVGFIGSSQQSAIMTCVAHAR